MTETQIDKDEFTQWLEGPVTKYVFKQIEILREEINATLTDADVVFHPDSAKRLARLVGQREGVDLLLNIEYEDVKDE